MGVVNVLLGAEQGPCTRALVKAFLLLLPPTAGQGHQLRQLKTLAGEQQILQHRPNKADSKGNRALYTSPMESFLFVFPFNIN